MGTALISFEPAEHPMPPSSASLNRIRKVFIQSRPASYTDGRAQHSSPRKQ